MSQTHFYSWLLLSFFSQFLKVGGGGGRPQSFCGFIGNLIGKMNNRHNSTSSSVRGETPLMRTESQHHPELLVCCSPREELLISSCSFSLPSIGTELASSAAEMLTQPAKPKGRIAKSKFSR